MKKVAIAVVVVVGVVIAGVLVIVLFTPTPVTWIISPFPSTHGYYPDLSISMRIGGGWLNGYDQWKIDGYGDVSYEGDYSGPWASMNGSAKLTPQQVEELVAAVRRANLWAVEDGNVSIYLCMDCDTVDFSITLNGQSKRISYFTPNCDGSMGRPAIFWPAQGLCDLQHEIEAIGQLAFPTRMPWPTPRPWPTATPVPPPMPTSPPPPFMLVGDLGILSQEPCGPPCFLGIQPGVTTFEEAALMLRNAGAPCGTVTAGMFLSCQSGSALISLWGPTVDGINLAPPAMITLAEFIAKYGPPDALVFQVSAPPMFYYDSLQTVVILPMQSADSYTLTPGTTITGVSYLAAAEYQKWSNMAKNYQQPWKGYGAYAPKMNP